MPKKDKGSLYWLLVVFILPFLIFYTLRYTFGPSFVICLIPVFFIIFMSGVFFFLDTFRNIFERSKKDIDWDESESVEGSVKEKRTTEKYSTEKAGGRRKEKGFFSRLFGGEEKCEECGAELEYREEGDAYFCPDCREYKWR